MLAARLQAIGGARTFTLQDSQHCRLLLTARYFSAGPSDSTSRWTPCPPKYSKQWLQVSLGCIQLSPSCPFRPLHTFRFLRPARLRTPLLGYGAPHLSARGTSTLLNNALLSAHFRIVDKPSGTPQALIWVQCIALILPTENGKASFRKADYTANSLRSSELPLSSTYVPGPNRRPYGCARG